MPEYKGTCQYCGLDLRPVKWRNEGLMVVGLAIVLGAIALYSGNYSVTNYRYIPVDGTIITQTYLTYPYSGLATVLGFIAAILLIAGVASAIVYDLRISKYSRKTRPPSVPPPSAAQEPGEKQ